MCSLPPFIQYGSFSVSKASSLDLYHNQVRLLNKVRETLNFAFEDYSTYVKDPEKRYEKGTKHLK